MILLHHPILSVFLFTGWVGAALVSHFGAGDWLVIVGAIAFALASIRGARIKVLRDSNNDFKDRNEQLEKEKAALSAQVTAFQAQPNLDTHALLLQKMLDTLIDHDTRMKDSADASASFWREITQTLSEIHVAVVPPR